jgi:hypothetical protein
MDEDYAIKTVRRSAARDDDVNTSFFPDQTRAVILTIVVKAVETNI